MEKNIKLQDIVFGTSLGEGKTKGIVKLEFRCIWERQSRLEKD